MAVRQYLDATGHLTQVDFETNQNRVLTIKGTNASDNDELGEVFEAPRNSFVLAVWQATPYGPITSIDTVNLPQNLLSSNGYFEMVNCDDNKPSGQRCEFRNSEFMPEGARRMAKKVTVLADG